MVRAFRRWNIASGTDRATVLEILECAMLFFSLKVAYF